MPKPTVNLYDEKFFAAQFQGSATSAAVIIPHILKIFPTASSVVDVGCGTAVWLHEFRKNGIKRTLGIDGGSPSEFLQISRDDFVSADLRKEFPVSERFDLAICLEVAEHLPVKDAENFISELCKLSDFIVFSAAIPGQGGTGHLNERWPSYWSGIFSEKGYDCHDILRHNVWFDSRVEWWYAQNILIFAKRGKFSSGSARTNGILDVVHPSCFHQFRKFAAERGYDYPVTQSVTEGATATLVSFTKKILTGFKRDKRSETEPYYLPSAPIDVATKYLFVEFPVSHEFLFDAYGKLPETQLIQVQTGAWWLNSAAYGYIFRSINPKLQLLFFLTLDRLLYNTDTKTFINFAQQTDVPLTGILHRLPAIASDHEALQATKHLIKDLVVLSEHLIPDIRELFGDEVRIHYLPHPASNQSYFGDEKAVRMHLGVRESDFVVSMLGEARSGKGFELLFDALKFIPEKDRDRLFFLFAGRGTAWSAEEMQGHLDRNGCRGFVDIRSSSNPHEYRLVSDQEFVNYIIASDLGLLLYQNEQRQCASGVMPNYVWARKPVLATKNSYVGRDIVQHELGSVLETETPLELAKNLSQYLLDKSWKSSAKYENFRKIISDESVILRLQKFLKVVASSS